MINVYDLLFYEIMYFLSNECLMKVEETNKENRWYLKERIFRKRIIHRRHPIIFNICNNYCKKCNFQPFVYFLTNSYFNPLLCDSCNHV